MKTDSNEINLEEVKAKIEEVLNQNLSVLLQSEQLGIYNDSTAQRKGFTSALQWCSDLLNNKKIVE